MRRLWTFLSVLLAVAAICFSIRADRQSRAAKQQLGAAEARIAAADGRIAELEQRVLEADTLRLAARVYSDDLVLRGMATAVADGVPPWDFVRTARLPEEE